MKNVLGIIFADSNHANLKELTSVRPLGALPIDGRYRLIDFVLSNMVNSGMNNVAVVTQNNYHSLLGHLESGKQWNLARKRDGLVLFPPFSNLGSTGSDSRIDVLFGLLGYLKRSSQKYVMLSESNYVCNEKFDNMFESHIKNNAEITIAYKYLEGFENDSAHEIYLTVDENNNVTNVDPIENIDKTDKKYFGSILINKQTLINIIESSKVRGKKGYFANLVTRNIGKLKINAFKCDFYGRKISTIKEYYDSSMEILNKDNRDTIFNTNHPIYTKDKDTTPTKYLENASVKNSLIADGCVIDGVVENSIISRNVVIKKGSVVRNSIIMQQASIGENVSLNAVILDKNVVVKDNKELAGDKSYPFVVSKGQVI